MLMAKGASFRSTVFLLVFTSVSFSQSSHPCSTPLDSLLLSGDVQTFMECWQQLSSTSEIQHVALEDSQSYGWLYRSFQRISNASEERVRELSLTFVKSYLISSADSRGEKALAASRKFLTAMGNEQYRDGLCWYYTTRYFSDRHSEYEKARLLRNFSIAKDLCSEGKYADALHLIEVFAKESPRISELTSLKDSLSFRYQELEKTLKGKISALNAELMGAPIRKKFAVSFAVGLASYGLKDMRMVMRHRTYPDLDITVGPIPDETQRIYKLQAEYYINPTLSIGAKTTAGTAYDHGFTAVDEVLHFKEKAYSFGVIGTFFATDQPGIRPYVRFEAGVVQVTRDEIRPNPSNLWYPEYAKISGLNIVYPQITVEFGPQYEFGQNSFLLLGLNCYIVNAFGDANVIQRLTFGVQMEVGMNLL